MGFWRKFRNSEIERFWIGQHWRWTRWLKDKSKIHKWTKTCTLNIAYKWKLKIPLWRNAIKKEYHYTRFVYIRSLRFKKILQRTVDLTPVKRRLLLRAFDAVEKSWVIYRSRWKSRKYFINLKYLLQMLREKMFHELIKTPVLKDPLRVAFQKSVFDYLVKNIDFSLIWDPLAVKPKIPKSGAKNIKTQESPVSVFNWFRKNAQIPGLRA